MAEFAKFAETADFAKIGYFVEIAQNAVTADFADVAERFGVAEIGENNEIAGPECWCCWNCRGCRYRQHFR